MDGVYSKLKLYIILWHALGVSEHGSFMAVDPQSVKFSSLLSFTTWNGAAYVQTNRILFHKHFLVRAWYIPWLQ